MLKLLKTINAKLNKLSKESYLTEKIDLKAFEDDVAFTTEWTPLNKEICANFNTKKIISTKDRLSISPNIVVKIFLAIQLLGWILFWYFLNFSLGLILFGLSLVFVYHSFRPRYFDRLYGYSYGWSWEEKNTQVHTDEIYAVQIIYAGKGSSGAGSRNYSKFELNLVLKSGDRHPVICIHDLLELEKMTEEISTFLGIKTWNAARLVSKA